MGICLLIADYVLQVALHLVNDTLPSISFCTLTRVCIMKHYLSCQKQLPVKGVRQSDSKDARRADLQVKLW